MKKWLSAVEKEKFKAEVEEALKLNPQEARVKLKEIKTRMGAESFIKNGYALSKELQKKLVDKIVPVLDKEKEAKNENAS